MIDLHTHSLFSDGELIPSELVSRAAAAGYRAIAITDHGLFRSGLHVAKTAMYSGKACCFSRQHFKAFKNPS